MENNSLKNLLDNIYELEGLVTLAVGRHHNSEHLLGLIARKGQAVNARCQEIAGGHIADNPGDGTKLEEYAIEGDNSPKAANTATPEPPAPPAITPQTPNPEPPQEADSQPAPAEETKSLLDLREEKIKNLEKMGETQGKLVFSINDKYRFKRGLFGDSDVDFNNSLAIVASMEDYEEAEEYFLNELEMDEYNPDVADFLAVIKKYFGE